MRRVLLTLVALMSFIIANSQVNHKKINHVLILGNSIVSHGPKPDIGWTGNWGMAASCVDSDFVHILKRKILLVNKNAEVRNENIGAFELNYSTFNLEEYKSIRDFKPDMIIIKIAENVNDVTPIEKNFQSYYNKLLQYLDPKSRAIKIIVDGFMPNQNVNKIVKQVASDGGYDFVSITPLFEDKTNTALGKYAHAGVAAHPSDKGMRLIAERIWSSIQKYF